MKKLAVILVIVGCVLLPKIYAGGRQPQPKTQAATHVPQVLSVPEPVKQWVITRQATVAVFPKKMVVTTPESRKEKAFPEGLVVKSAVSPNKNYFALLRVLPLPPTDKRPRKLFISVFNQQAEPISTIAIENPYDAPYPELAIADNGTIVLGRPAEAIVETYSPDGHLLKKWSLLPQSEFDLERILIPAFLGSSSEIIIAATRHGMDTNRHMEPFLIKYSESGKSAWKKVLNANAMGLLAVSPAGNTIAISTYSFHGQDLIRRTEVMDSSGRLLSKANILFQTASFSPDGRMVLLGDKQTLVLLDLQQKNQLWKKPLVHGPEMIVAATIDKNQRIAVLTAKNVFRNGQFVFTEPRLLFLDSTGTILSEQQFPNQFITHPVLQFDATGETLFIGFQKQLQKIKVEL